MIVLCRAQAQRLPTNTAAGMHAPSRSASCQHTHKEEEKHLRHQLDYTCFCLLHFSESLHQGKHVPGVYFIAVPCSNIFVFETHHLTDFYYFNMCCVAERMRWNYCSPFSCFSTAASTLLTDTWTGRQEPFTGGLENCSRALNGCARAYQINWTSGWSVAGSGSEPLVWKCP